MTTQAQPITLLLSGYPGSMCREVALAAQGPGMEGRFQAMRHALGGPNTPRTPVAVGAWSLTPVTPDERASLEIPPGTIAIDFTEPAAALGNVSYFCQRGIPFVLGTTGFDGAVARAIVRDHGVSAVIAPNMAIPIVLIQAALEHLAEEFPAAMAGYQFGLMESHQRGKKDTSGTAKALVESFARLGLPATREGIKMVRDPQVQRQELGVPESHLGGHAYHFYTMASPDGDVRVELSHRVHGRRVYAEGALHAAAFLARRVAADSRGEVFTMTDVLAGMMG